MFLPAQLMDYAKLRRHLRQIKAVYSKLKAFKSVVPEIAVAARDKRKKGRKEAVLAPPADATVSTPFSKSPGSSLPDRPSPREFPTASGAYLPVG
jgi:hypothetical protein